MGWVGKVFNTPWEHQVHHARNVAYLDRNHGGILIVWDKLFGTFQANQKEIPAQFGVLHPPHQHDPITLNFHEFADIWRDVKKARSWETNSATCSTRPAGAPTARAKRPNSYSGNWRRKMKWLRWLSGKGKRFLSELGRTRKRYEFMVHLGHHASKTTKIYTHITSKGIEQIQSSLEHSPI